MRNLQILKNNLLKTKFHLCFVLVLASMKMSANTLPIDIESQLLHIQQDVGYKDLNIREAKTNEANAIYEFIELCLDEAKSNNLLSQAETTWLNIENIRSEIRTVKIYFNISDQAIVGSARRIGSIYLTQEKAIVVNMALYQKLSQIVTNLQTEELATINIGMEIMLIHEFLGALGYPDQNYEISNLVWMSDYAADYGAQIFEPLLKNLNFKYKNTERLKENIIFLSEGGNSTGVGGGGDPASITLKIITYATLGQHKTFIRNKYHLNEFEFQNLVISLSNIDIEPMQIEHAYTNQAKANADFYLASQKNKWVYFVNESKIMKTVNPSEINQLGYQFIDTVITQVLKK